MFYLLHDAGSFGLSPPFCLAVLYNVLLWSDIQRSCKIQHAICEVDQYKNQTGTVTQAAVTVSSKFTENSCNISMQINL